MESFWLRRTNCRTSTKEAENLIAITRGLVDDGKHLAVAIGSTQSNHPLRKFAVEILEPELELLPSASEHPTLDVAPGTVVWSKSISSVLHPKQ